MLYAPDTPFPVSYTHLSGSTALSDDEVDRMVKDAEAHAEEDKKQKEEVEVRNQKMCIRDRCMGNLLLYGAVQWFKFYYARSARSCIVSVS